MFGNSSELFPEVAAQRRQALVKAAAVVAYLTIAGVVVVTAAHAVMLVMYSAAEAVPVGGLTGRLLNLLRIAFPVLAEVGAVAVILGHFGHVWRGPQRGWALAVELVWLLFAALNLVTVFTLETGAALAGWQRAWVMYGFPVSSLAIGTLTYLTLKASPDHLRAEEMAAQQERAAMLAFKAEADVLQSSQYRQVLAQRGWLQVVDRLKAQGYTPDQVRYMLSGVPELASQAAITAQSGAGAATGGNTGRSAGNSPENGSESVTEAQGAAFVPFVNGGGPGV